MNMYDKMQQLYPLGMMQLEMNTRKRMESDRPDWNKTPYDEQKKIIKMSIADEIRKIGDRTGDLHEMMVTGYSPLTDIDRKKQRKMKLKTKRCRCKK